MSDRRLRFSERKRLADHGSLGDLVSADVPEELRRAVRNYLGRNYFDLRPWQQMAAEHFGWPGGIHAVDQIGRSELDEFADLLEMLVEYASRYSGYRVRVQDELNALFDRHRWAYRFEDGDLVMIGSPALVEIVVGPALLATQQPGWEEVERRFREALLHQRGGPDENDDALTAASAALEAALKAVGLAGNTLGALAAEFGRSALAPGQVAGIPAALEKLMKASAALRNTMSDAHGHQAGQPPVPQALVDLTIHLTGAFIVYLDRLGEPGQ